MKSIVGKVLTVGAIAFAVSFLAILLMADTEYALFISPSVAMIAGMFIFVSTFEKYGHNRISADNPIDSTEINQWIKNSLLVSVPLLALSAGTLTQVISKDEVSYLPFANLMLYLVLLIIVVTVSIVHLAIPHVNSTKSRLSEVSFIQKFNHWLDVKA